MYIHLFTPLTDASAPMHLMVVRFDMYSSCGRAVVRVASDLTQTCENLATQVMIQGGEAAHKKTLMCKTCCCYDSPHALVALGIRCSLPVVALSMVAKLGIYIHNILESHTLPGVPGRYT